MTNSSDNQPPAVSTAPVIIGAEEQLARIFLHPDHLDDEGKIHPAAINSEDIYKPKKGFSVNRTAYVTLDYHDCFVEYSCSKGVDKQTVYSSNFELADMVGQELAATKTDAAVRLYAEYAPEPAYPHINLPRNDAHAVLKTSLKVGPQRSLAVINELMIPVMNEAMMGNGSYRPLVEANVTNCMAA